MWTLDASVYVRAADPNDPDQATCQALIDALDDQAAPLIVPRLLLAEIAGALRRLTRDPIRALGRRYPPRDAAYPAYRARRHADRYCG